MKLLRVTYEFNSVFYKNRTVIYNSSLSVPPFLSLCTEDHQCNYSHTYDLFIVHREYIEDILFEYFILQTYVESI